VTCNAWLRPPRYTAIDTFGGTPAKFWGKPTSTFYPVGPHSTQTFFENFDNVLPNNPCQP